MTATTVDAKSIPPISHAEAAGLAEEAYARFAELLARVGADDWDRPTDCEGWTVRDLAGHVVGAMRSAASMREQLSQTRDILRRSRTQDGPMVDHMTAVQVERTADLDPAALVAECRALVGPAARGRARTPAPLRRFARMRVKMGEIDERWRLGYLVDIILTRDAWLHRVDLGRAIGASIEFDAAHDGRVVADVVAEWARRHGRPFDLTLHGPAGGRFVVEGPDPEVRSIDAVEFCRVLSGRADGDGLLAQSVPF